jgi:hypothetical protein
MANSLHSSTVSLQQQPQQQQQQEEGSAPDLDCAAAQMHLRYTLLLLAAAGESFR